MLSIIIPTLNEEKIMEKTLLSLKELKDVPYEIIISDGKSRDRTVEIAKKYADKVVVYEGEKRQNIGMGRNLGAKSASGDILLFLDADMHIPDINNFIKKALGYFSDEKLVALTVYLKIFPEMATFGDRLVPWFFNKFIFLCNNIFHYGASSGEFQMIRKKVFDQVNGFDERLVAGEDFELFARLSRHGRTKCDSALTVFHTSRRAHKIGWPKLLYFWFMNWVHSFLLGRAWSEEWEEIR